MAIEYTFYGAAEVSTSDLRAAVADAISGSVAVDGTVEREGLDVSAFTVSPGDEASAPRLFGFAHRVTVLFRFANLKRHLEEHNTALMISAVLAINDRTGADGVLLFNGEEAVVLCKHGEAIFAAEWEDWDDNPEVVALRADRLVAPVAQPML